MGFKLYLNKIYVSPSKINNFERGFETEFSCEFFQLRESEDYQGKPTEAIARNSFIASFHGPCKLI